MPDEDHQDGDAQQPPAADNPASAAAPSKPVAPATPAERWLTPNELETLRSRLKKRFH